MKQKDLALFLVVGIVSIIFSVVLSNYLITPAKSKTQKAEVVEAITASFDTPPQDSPYFNKDSINPTQLIIIGGSPNDKPFQATN